jgi:hypothetical protein
MAVIYETTMSPGKLELLAVWLPTRAWFRDSGQPPQLRKAGGFRLDDPAGEVGMEFMVVTDSSAAEPVTYHVPLTYRGDPLDGAEDGLVGTSLHGVLGQRWLYDGTRDPVLAAQVATLLAGKAQPQAQQASDTPDISVTVTIADTGFPAGELVSTRDGSDYTDITIGDSVIRIERVLRPGPEPESAHVTAPWQLPDGTHARGVFLKSSS